MPSKTWFGASDQPRPPCVMPGPPMSSIAARISPAHPRSRIEDCNRGFRRSMQPDFLSAIICEIRGLASGELEIKDLHLHAAPAVPLIDHRTERHAAFAMVQQVR